MKSGCTAGWTAQRATLREEVSRQGYWRSSDDVILTDDGPSPPGVGLFRHAVARASR